MRVIQIYLAGTAGPADDRDCLYFSEHVLLRDAVDEAQFEKWIQQAREQIQGQTLRIEAIEVEHSPFGQAAAYLQSLAQEAHEHGYHREDKKSKCPLQQWRIEDREFPCIVSITIAETLGAAYVFEPMRSQLGEKCFGLFENVEQYLSWWAELRKILEQQGDGFHLWYEQINFTDFAVLSKLLFENLRAQAHRVARYEKYLAQLDGIFPELKSE